jgi:hypothetical protein
MLSAQALQRDCTVFGFLDVRVAQFLQQIAHDAAHRGEIVYYEETGGRFVHVGWLHLS